MRRRVLHLVKLSPQTVKIGMIEPDSSQPEANFNDAENENLNQAANSNSQNQNNSQNNSFPQNNAPEIKPSQPDKEIIAQINMLTEKLSNEQLRNMELTEAKNKLESEINGVKMDYESRKRAIEADAAANAKKAADEARIKGHDEGFDNGYKEGLIKAREEIQREYLEKFSDLVQVIDNAGKKLDENFESLVNLNQPRLIRVWTEMLNRMLKRQVELNPDTIDNVLMDLLSRLSDKNQIVIYVSPDDLKYLEGEIDTKFQEVLRGVKRLELKPDSSVEKGSCIVETALGVYDARWRTQMSQIENVVDDIFKQVAKDEK